MADFKSLLQDFCFPKSWIQDLGGLEIPEFKNLANLKILTFQNPEFKIMAELEILPFQNLEFKILAHFKL